MTQCIRPNDPRLSWPGAVSVQYTDEWAAPWHIPHQDRALFPPERLRERFQMPSGVRHRLRRRGRRMANSELRKVCSFGTPPGESSRTPSGKTWLCLFL